jgi:hypothetical protein
MTDFTPEQEAEIQKRINEAKQFEQYRTAGLTAFKWCQAQLGQVCDQYDPKTGQLVQRGIFDAHVYTVFTNEYQRFLETYFPQPNVTEPKQNDSEKE